MAKVVAVVGKPVAVNGDIVCGATARQALEQSGAAGYLVGRAVTGLPWKLKQIEAEREGRPWDLPLSVQAQSHEALLEEMLRFYGHDLGLRSYRKHFAAWAQTLNLLAPMRRHLLTAERPQALFDFLRQVGNQYLAQAA